MTIIDEILEFMVDFQFTFYDNLFFELGKLKNKSKSLIKYLNHYYGNSKMKNIDYKNLFFEATTLQKLYPRNIQIIDDKLKILILNTQYSITIGYIFINNTITMSQYPILLVTFLEIPKLLNDKENDNVRQYKKDFSFPPNPCLSIQPINCLVFGGNDQSQNNHSFDFDPIYEDNFSFNSIPKKSNNIDKSQLLNSLLQQFGNKKIIFGSTTTSNTKMSDLLQILEFQSVITENIIEIGEQVIFDEKIKNTKPYKDDIQLIMQQTGCSESIVQKEYKNCDYDIVNTIMSLTY